MKYLYLYLGLINLLAVIVTGYDKRAAQLQHRRVRERTLMLISALGGAPGMYLTMLIVRHKTRKPLFMMGIPLIFVLELLVFFAARYYVQSNI